jgi:hypothetical protein
MKFSNLALICLLIVSASCKNKKEAQQIKTKHLQPKLELAWQTDSILTTCEAVLYDKKSKIIYVANINNNPWEKDNNGFISTIDTLGNIIEHKWIEGLSAPKGMGVFNNTLYVNDIDRVVEIDIKTKTITNSYEVADEPQLNDITVSPEGVVYASGSNSNTVYELKDGTMKPIISGEFGRLNGLLHQPEGLYFLSSNNHQFGIMNLEDKTSKILTNDIGHGDGIIKLENGGFITSSWKGAIFYINASDWSKTLLLDTGVDSINAADIDYIPAQNMLLVPTFFHNKVLCYRVSYE